MNATVLIAWIILLLVTTSYETYNQAECTKNALSKNYSTIQIKEICK
jgi:hypothetical protein